MCRGQERIELYLYSPYGPYGLYRASVPVQGCTLTLHLHRRHTQNLPSIKEGILDYIPGKGRLVTA